MCCFLADTGAMAVLALTCVKDIKNGQEKIDTEDLNKIDNHIKSLVEKILSHKKENGLLGNTYSTGEAMQVSQRIKQETEGRHECKNSRILSYWPPEILHSLIPILTDFM